MNPMVLNAFIAPFPLGGGEGGQAGTVGFKGTMRELPGGGVLTPALSPSEGERERLRQRGGVAGFMRCGRAYFSL